MKKNLINFLSYFLLSKIEKKNIHKKKFLEIILDDNEKKLLSFKKKGYLKEMGWLKSYQDGTPVNALSQPIPWLTYSFLNFIDKKLNKQISVFEYGSGNSTLYFSQRTKNVISVEHDEEWFKFISNKKPDNAEIIFEPLTYGGKYSEKAVDAERKFEIIIIDGRDRVNCCKMAVNALTTDGVIVLDDSERDQYEQAIEILKNKDFHQIEFWGISPGIFYNKCTSLFYRDTNWTRL